MHFYIQFSRIVIGEFRNETILLALNLTHLKCDLLCERVKCDKIIVHNYNITRKPTY